MNPSTTGDNEIVWPGYHIRPNDAHSDYPPLPKGEMDREKILKYRHDYADFLDQAPWFGFWQGDNIDWRRMLQQLDEPIPPVVDEQGRGWHTVHYFEQNSAASYLSKGISVQVIPRFRIGSWYIHGFQNLYAYRSFYVTWDVKPCTCCKPVALKDRTILTRKVPNE